MERRTELTDEQKPEEPQNADSHLAVMAGALRTCVSYTNRVDEPMCFVDLDGVHAGRARRRVTSVIGYSQEEPVVDLIPAMLAAFLESDRAFCKGRAK